MAAVRRSCPGMWLLFLLLGSPLLHVAVSLEPITTGFTIGAASAAIVSYLYSEIHDGLLVESCQVDNYFDSTALENDLTEKLFGQHLAHEIIYKSLTKFMTSENPKKPLALILYGSTGTGKNLVSKIIAQNIYDLGGESKFVHLFVSTLHFPHDSLIHQYKDQLQSWIRGNTSECARSIFIFDEMEKLHPGLIDAIKPFLDYYDRVDGVSYRKAIFIFINNAGAHLIERLMPHIFGKGKWREDLKLKDVEDELSDYLYNNRNSGFWRSGLIEKNLIDYIVPFLPLEFRHVRKCVLAELRLQGLHEDEELASQIAEEMMTEPKDTKLFSLKGCKTVSTKLDIYL